MADEGTVYLTIRCDNPKLKQGMDRQFMIDAFSDALAKAPQAMLDTWLHDKEASTFTYKVPVTGHVKQ